MLKLVRRLFSLLSALLLLDKGVSILGSLFLSCLLVLSWQTLAVRGSSLLSLGLRSLTTIHRLSLSLVKSCTSSRSTNALGLSMVVDHLHRLGGGGKVRNVPGRLLVLPLTIQVLTQYFKSLPRPLVLLLWLGHEALLWALRFLLTKLVFEL